jgi:hypothetical protein
MAHHRVDAPHPRLPTTIQRRLFAVHGTPATALESVTINNHP